MTKDETYNIDDMLARVREAWVKTPGLRFGQLVVGVVAPKGPCTEVFYIKDRDLRGRLTEWTAKNSETNKTEI